MIQSLLVNATSPFIIAACHGFAGRIAVERGELDRAGRLLERGWALMQDSGGFQLIGPALAALVLLEIRRGDLHRAREHARDGVDRAVDAPGDLEYTAELYWLGMRVETELAERARALRDHGPLADHEQRAVEICDALAEAISEVPGDGPRPEAVAFQALACAELTRVQGKRDPAPWRAAGDRFRTIGLVYPAAYADLRAAEALALSGAPRAEIAAPLRAAHTVALEVGSPPFLEEVAGLARRAGVSLGAREDEPHVDTAATLGLTHRELEVLRLLADGRTNRQIADELFITPKTASVHVSRILMKLGVSNRAAAAAAAHRIGLAPRAGVE
jgi:DNA-binding CsgD family transcriptional regulator